MSRKLGVLILCGVLVMLAAAWPAHAQTTTYIREQCVLAWDPVTLSVDGTPATDLAGYRVWAVEGSVSRPIVELRRTATSHPTSTTCQALGVTGQGLITFNVVSFDLAGNFVATPSTITATRDTVAPRNPAGMSVTSPQPTALIVTPHPDRGIETVSWEPGTCNGLRTVKRLVSGTWRLVGTTALDFYQAPITNVVSPRYGVSAVCTG